MKISKEDAWKVLEIANHHWVTALDEHGDGDVDLEAFAHLIAFKFSDALDMVVHCTISSAFTEGLEDSIEAPAERVADELRVVH